MAYRGMLMVVWLLLLAAVAPCRLDAAPDSLVNKVELRLEFEDGQTQGPAGMTSGIGAETMAQLEQALTDTVEMALLTQLSGDLEYISSHQNSVVQTLGEVMNSALAKRGFTLQELVLDPGVTTHVTVRLSLNEERIQDFSVSFYLLGNTPVIDELCSADEDSISAQLYGTLARTPYGDARWLSGLITETVEQKLSAMPAYRDFDHIVLAQPGQTTKIAVTFTPRPEAEALTRVSFSVNSLSIPNLSLQPLRDQLGHFMQSLEGAPLSFIEARLPEIRQALYQHLINHPALAQHCPEASLELKLNGCALRAAAALDSTRFLLGLRSRIALWDVDDGAWEGRVSARAGFMPAGGWAIFGELDWFPGEERSFPMLGAAQLIGNSALLGAGWDFEAESLRALGQLELAPAACLACDLIFDGDYDKQSEISLHYRIRDNYEIQLVSNLDGEVFAALGASL